MNAPNKEPINPAGGPFKGVCPNTKEIGIPINPINKGPPYIMMGIKTIKTDQ